MSGEKEVITNIELQAIIGVQSKNVEQLTIIANHLSTIVERENKIYDRLYNGISKEISDKVIEVVKNCNLNCGESHGSLITKIDNLPTTIQDKINNSNISKDMEHVKWFVGIVGLLIVAATIILRGIDSREFTNLETKQYTSLAQKLDDHLGQVVTSKIK